MAPQPSSPILVKSLSKGRGGGLGIGARAVKLAMETSPMRRLVAGLLLVLAVLLPAVSRAGEDVDLALVIAVDVSNSMDIDEQALQREGFVLAFRSPQVHDAIRKGT